MNLIVFLGLRSKKSTGRVEKSPIWGTKNQESAYDMYVALEYAKERKKRTDERCQLDRMSVGIR